MSITQAATRTVIAGAQAHARELGLLITVAVVDTGGLLDGPGPDGRRSSAQRADRRG